MKKTTKVLAVVLVCMMAVAVLVACAPNSDPDKAKAALENNGYTAAKDEKLAPVAFALLGIDGVECVVSGSKTVGEGDSQKVETVTIIYFSSADNVNAAWDKIQEYANDENENNESDWTVNKSGKMVYFGTSAAIKAAR